MYLFVSIYPSTYRYSSMCTYITLIQAIKAYENVRSCISTNTKVCKYVKIFGYFLVSFEETSYLCIAIETLRIKQHVTSYFSFT